MQSPLQLGILVLFILALLIFVIFLKAGRVIDSAVLLPVILTSLVYPFFINWRYFMVLYPLYLYLALVYVRTYKALKLSIPLVLITSTLIGIYGWVNNLGYMV